MENNNEQRIAKLGKALIGLGIAVGYAAFAVIKKKKNKPIDISEVEQEFEEELDA